MKRKTKIIIGICLLIGVLSWIIYTNVVVGFSEYTLYYETLPEEFDGFKIAQVSDFHNADFGDVGESVVKGIKGCAPDIIVITGDFVDSSRNNADSKRTDIKNSLELAEDLAELAPCYYVTGNHEAWLMDDTYAEFEEGLIKCGVTVLRDSEVIITRGTSELSLIGVDDPEYAKKTNGIAKTMDKDKINELSTDGLFTIMLSHRPEFYETYLATDVNLVFSGHVHGGQFRLPFVGGLYGPHQGLFPEYDSGVYEDDEFAMVVSRGVGNSVFPVRFNNQPEVVLVELRCE